MHPGLKNALRPYVRAGRRRVRPYVVAGRRLLEEPPSVSSIAYSAPRSYSQFGEDRWLLRRFEGRVGFYVDVGAFHPFHISNTCLLYDRGWRGINLEPAPDGLALLKRHRPNDLNLPIAVASVEQDVTFALSGSFAGIADDSHLWPDYPGERISVATQTLARVLHDHLPGGQHIDLLDVDCEGHDLDVLRSNDWERFRPEVILAEAHNDGGAVAIGEFLGTVGYEERSRLDLTFVYERAE